MQLCNQQIPHPRPLAFCQALWSLSFATSSWRRAGVLAYWVALMLGTLPAMRRLAGSGQLSNILGGYAQGLPSASGSSRHVVAVSCTSLNWLWIQRAWQRLCSDLKIMPPPSLFPPPSCLAHHHHQLSPASLVVWHIIIICFLLPLLSHMSSPAVPCLSCCLTHHHHELSSAPSCCCSSKRVPCSGGSPLPACYCPGAPVAGHFPGHCLCSAHRGGVGAGDQGPFHR